MTAAMMAQIFELCIIPLMAVLTGYLVSYIQVKRKELITKTEQMENQTHQQMVQKYIYMAEDTVIKCVKATNQTFVDSLKDKNEFTHDACAEAFKKTYEAVISILGDEGVKYLQEGFGDAELYLVNLIEATVKENKK